MTDDDAGGGGLSRDDGTMTQEGEGLKMEFFE